MVTQNMVFEMLRKISTYDVNIGKFRVGNLHDGGYIIPDDCKNLDALLSLGIGGDVSFDKYFAERGVIVYQYDHTIDEPPIKHKNFIFNKKGIGPVRHGCFITLDDILHDNALSSNNIALKFDIEAAEWDSFSLVSAETISKFRFIICELHWINNIKDDIDVFKKYKMVIDILTTFHRVIHFHANNYSGLSLYKGIPIPEVFELTLLRKDRGQFFPSFAPIPSPYDFPNNPSAPDIVMTPYLFRSYPASYLDYLVKNNPYPVDEQAMSFGQEALPVESPLRAPHSDNSVVLSDRHGLEQSSPCPTSQDATNPGAVAQDGIAKFRKRLLHPHHWETMSERNATLTQQLATIQAENDSLRAQLTDLVQTLIKKKTANEHLAARCGTLLKDISLLQGQVMALEKQTEDLQA